MAQTVAIVGAGIAGLCTAKLLTGIGYRVQVFDHERELGGVWASSRRYPGLTTQNPRDTYAFSDFPMPRDYPEWPNGAQMQAYLKSYAAHFDIADCIAFGTHVVSARQQDSGSGWTVVTRGADAQAAASRDFDWLIICNGIFSRPNVPDYPGLALFRQAGGRLIHTSEFNELEDAAGKHVIIVGYGKSSCDIATASVRVSSSSTLLARQLIWKIPKHIGNFLNFKHLLLTRFGEALFPYIELRGIERFLHGKGRFLRNALLTMVQRTIARQLKLGQIGLQPRTPLETIARSTVSLVSDGFYENVAAGKLRVLLDEIVGLDPHQAVLKSGAKAPADIIVCGTGWVQSVPFLSEGVRNKITDDAGNFFLYRSILPIDVARLAFIGYNSSFFSQLSAEVASFWLAEYMAGRLVLPPRLEQERITGERLAWMSARTGGNHCKGTNIVPFSLHYIDELLKDIKLSLPAPLRLLQWLRSVRADDFSQLADKVLARSAGTPP